MGHLPVLTIASNNYLASARTLVESYREHHPGAEVYACIVDRPDPRIDYESLPFVTIFARDLGIPRFRNLAFRYDILELNTAVKPFALTHLRDRFGVEAALYFDPDILIYDRLTGVEEALASHAAALTPHVTQPLDNAHDPAERKILMVGVYNLGFLGIRLDDTTAGFLDWWQDRLYRHCRVDPHNGLFVDQSWMSLAPAYLESVAVLRDPIYNVAYWNLPHRHPRFEKDCWRIDGRRVGFFHFSGLGLEDLDALSRHQTRLAPGERPELRPLFEAYRDRVLAAGHRRFENLPYGFSRFTPCGVEIPWVARRLLQRVDPMGRRWPDPFDSEAEDSFFAWLVEPQRFVLGSLNRAALAYWEERSDLVRTFREPTGSDLGAFVDWLYLESETPRAVLPPSFLEGVEMDPLPAEGTRAAPRLSPSEARHFQFAREVLSSVDLERPGSFLPWLNEPIPGVYREKPLITRLVMLIYLTRDDLRRLYPEPLDRDQRNLAYWFCLVAAETLRLAPRLVEPVRRTLPWRSRLSLAWKALMRRGQQAVEPSTVTAGAPSSPKETVGPSAPGAPGGPPDDGRPNLPGPATRTARPSVAHGINLVGPFEGAGPIGRLARGNLAALRRAGVETVPVPVDQDTWGKIAHGRIHQMEGVPYPVTVLQTSVAQTAEAAGVLPVPSAVTGVRVGYWFWDLAHLPMAWAQFFDYVDEVWAPSGFSAEVYRSLADVPVRRVWPCVPALEAPTRDRRECGLEDGTFYLFASVDARGVSERENPFAAVEVMRRLRGRCRAAGLVLRVENAAADPALVNALRRESADLPVRIDTDPAVSTAALVAACDALLSLHRADSLGVPAIEALHLRKPVVATGYGGVTDFLDDSTGYPVAYALTRLKDHAGPFPAGSVWAEPDLEHAAGLVAEILEDPAAAAERAAAGCRRVHELFGTEAAAQRFAGEAKRLFARL